MARNDGKDRTCVRNAKIQSGDIVDIQKHNERENEVYKNEDIILDRAHLNVHFKTPDDSYENIFSKMESEKLISTRGLKSDAVHFAEMVFDVNSAYFDNHGGYDFAKKFYEDAYKSAIDIVGGEDYIVSAVMHADEINRAMTEALGREVYHYHMHVVYIPVVEKEILWSKRCKDKALVGTLKEKIMQVSHSKKWNSVQAVDDLGNPMFNANGKPILKKSYSVLQDKFYNHMKVSGYDDIERGEYGSTEEHLSVTQFKVQRESERLSELVSKSEIAQGQLEKLSSDTEKQKQIYDKYVSAAPKLKKIVAGTNDIDAMGRKNITGNIVFTLDEASELKDLAKNGMIHKVQNADLSKKLDDVTHDRDAYRSMYFKLKEETKLYFDAIKIAPSLVRSFLLDVINKFKDKQRQAKLVADKDRQKQRELHPKKNSYDMER